MYIDIYRFSENGFESQFQSHIKEHSKRSETIGDLLSNIDNDYLRTLIINGNKKICDKFELDGVFVFLEKPKDEDVRYYLNHLEKKQYNRVKNNFYHAKINIDAICYFDKGFVFESKNRGSVKDAIENKENTLYIPKSSLSMIKDVKKIIYKEKETKKYKF